MQLKYTGTLSSVSLEDGTVLVRDVPKEVDDTLGAIILDQQGPGEGKGNQIEEVEE